MIDGVINKGSFITVKLESRRNLAHPNLYTLTEFPERLESATEYGPVFYEWFTEPFRGQVVLIPWS